MSGVSRIVIHEKVSELLRLMKEQKRLRQRARIQTLYLLKSGEASSIAQTDLAPNPSALWRHLV